MKGIHSVRVKSRRVDYQFELARNITVVRGDSGTGKTTLFTMIADHMRSGEASGVTVQCDVPCMALTDIDWKNQLQSIKGSIVFIDEGFAALTSEDFAAAAQASDNYYVIFSREDLYQLPYSVDEIYRIKTSGKFHTLQRMYSRNDRFVYSIDGQHPGADFDTVLTEDSKSGFQFFDARFAGTGIAVETAATNSGVCAWLRDNSSKVVFVIADGAAFGAYADKALKIQREYPEHIAICLPESFEWLILKSGIIKAPELDMVLDNPAEFIDCAVDFSWERYFTRLLQRLSKGTPFEYQKSSLKAAYMVRDNADKVTALIETGNVK